MSRVCTSTGLAIVDEELEGFRIAKSSYGPTSPIQRPPLPPRSLQRNKWSRFDTAGSTIYLADTKRTAFLETLAPIRIGPEFRSAVAFAAKTFGIPLADARAMVEADWVSNGNMVPGWLPASWRDGRLMYNLRVPAPVQCVDLTDDISIAALNREIGERLEALREPGITLGTFTGNNRRATTVIAEWIRDQVLDDGSFADGIKFHSKYGTGTCWAYWLRRRDLNLSGDPVSTLSESEIPANDPDLTSVLDLYGAKCR